MYEIIINYAETATRSDFFAGGLALGAFGAAIAVLRLLWAALAGVIRKRLWVNVTIDNRTDAFRHISLWMEETGALRHTRSVIAGRDGTRFGPAPGRHWFIREGRLVLLQRSLSEKTKVGGSHLNKPMETLTFSILMGSVKMVEGWLAEGGTIAETQNREAPALHCLTGDYWNRTCTLRRRDPETVLADDDRIDRLVADVCWFYGAADWYGARGIPWRRGYLLHGPPGTGKSSAIRAIASAVGVDIAMIDIARASLTDDALRDALVEAPEGALIAIEDIDAVFAGRASERECGITFSGLLNALDGVAAQEGHALVMTTNHRERLDPALIRPGRADVHVELGHVGAAAATRLFLRFFPEEAALAERFRGNLGTAIIAPAAVQGWLVECLEDPARAATAEGLRPAQLAIAAE